jgi:hypothetical protein
VVTAIRDGDEDLGHHQLDDRKNNCMSLLLQDGQYMYKIRKYNFVGEMLNIHANETNIPCDFFIVRIKGTGSEVCATNAHSMTNLKL